MNLSRTGMPDSEQVSGVQILPLENGIQDVLPLGI